MELKLKQQSWISEEQSDKFGRCPRCGRAVAENSGFCLVCRRAAERRNIGTDGNRRGAGVKWAIVVVIVLIVLAAGAVFIKVRVVAAQGTALAPPTALAPISKAHTTVVTPPPAPSAPTLVEKIVVCPTCRGTRRLAEAATERTYVCPVCAGSGTRTRRFRADTWKICDGCSGMGYNAVKDDHFRTHNRIKRLTCPICGGRGLVAAHCRP